MATAVPHSHHGCVVQAADTSPYATSIASTMRTWGPALHRGLVEEELEGPADDMAFAHVCGKLVTSFLPFLLSSGILKCADDSERRCLDEVE